MNRTKYIYSVIVSVLFFSLTAFYLLNDLLHFYTAPVISVYENRFLARKPFWTINKADPYPGQFEKFYNDHFPFRMDLINFNAGVINYRILRKSPYPKKVSFGKNGWMYFELERPVYEGEFMITPKQADSVAFEMHKRSEFFRNKGIRFYFISPPLKNEIYPEFLPSRYYRRPGGTVTDLIMEKIRKDSSIPYIDLKQPLLQAKQRGKPLYYKTDTHWNSWGAYFGYLEVMKRISRDFPSVKTLSEADFTLSYPKIKGKNLVEVMNLTDYISDEDVEVSLKDLDAKTVPPREYPKHPNSPFPRLYERNTGETGKPTIMIITDSFGYSIIPFFDKGFSRVVFVFDTGYYGTNENIVNDVKPDLVLMIMYEPHLVNIIGIDK